MHYQNCVDRLAAVENNSSLLFLNRIIFYFFSLLLFFPSITFSVIPAEVFPWALLFVIFYLKRVDYPILLLSLLLFTSAIMTLILKGSPVVLEVFRSLAAYMNVLLIFALLMQGNPKILFKLSKIARFVFILISILGVLQLSGLLSSFDQYFKMLIPRGYASSLDFMGGRGVTLLSSEPARAGIEYLFIYMVVRTAFIKPKQTVYGDIFVGLFLLFFIKSATSIAFYLIFIALFYRYFVVIMLPALLAAFYLLFIQLDFQGGRVVILVKELLEQSSFDEVFYIILNTSGHRVLSIIASYNYAFYSIIGGGVGNWMESSLIALEYTGYDLSTLNYFKVHGESDAVPIRASGFFSNLLIDTGLIGGAVFLWYLYSKFKKYWVLYQEAKPIILLFLIKILFFGSVGNPVSWVSVALCLTFLKMQKLKLI
jgi:hypothetical protein